MSHHPRVSLIVAMGRNRVIGGEQPHSLASARRAAVVQEAHDGTPHRDGAKNLRVDRSAAPRPHYRHRLPSAGIRRPRRHRRALVEGRDERRRPGRGDLRHRRRRLVSRGPADRRSAAPHDCRCRAVGRHVHAGDRSLRLATDQRGAAPSRRPARARLFLRAVPKNAAEEGSVSCPQLAPWASG